MVKSPNPTEESVIATIKQLSTVNQHVAFDALKYKNIFTEEIRKRIRQEINTNIMQGARRQEEPVFLKRKEGNSRGRIVQDNSGLEKRNDNMLNKMFRRYQVRDSELKTRQKRREI